MSWEKSFIIFSIQEKSSVVCSRNTLQFSNGRYCIIFTKPLSEQSVISLPLILSLSLPSSGSLILLIPFMKWRHISHEMWRVFWFRHLTNSFTVVVIVVFCYINALYTVRRICNVQHHKIMIDRRAGRLLLRTTLPQWYYCSQKNTAAKSTGKCDSSQLSIRLVVRVVLGFKSSNGTSLRNMAGQQELTA